MSSDSVSSKEQHEHPERSELAQFMSGRAAIYALLARFYREEADPELLTRLAAMRIPASEGSPETNCGFRLIENFVGGREGQGMHDLAIDFARVFLGAGPESAFPYESVYTSPEKLLMQDARDCVLRIYRSEGLGCAAHFNEPEDHLALELEFMAHLCRRAASCPVDGEVTGLEHLLTAQQAFLRDHLLNWVPLFARDAERIAMTSFYKGVARLTADFLQLDLGVVEQLQAAWALSQGSPVTRS